MLGQAGGHFLYFRTEGYPLLLALSGVTAFGSFRGLFLAQAAMAVAVPPLVYRMLRPIDARAALAASLLVLIAGIPVVFSKTVMTETSYVFLATLMLVAARRAVAPTSDGALYAMAAAASGLALLRPSARLLAVLLCIYVAWARYRIVPSVRAALVPPAVAIALTLCLGALAGVYHTHIAAEVMPGWRTLSAPPPGGESAMTGKLLFLNIYLAGSHYVPGGAVTADNGPATRDLLSALDRFAAAHPGRLRAFAPDDASPAGDPVAPSQLAVAAPSIGRQFDWWMAMDAVFGVEAADRLFLQASVEAFRQHPQIALHAPRNAAVTLFGPSQRSIDGHVRLILEPLSLEQFADDPALGRGLSAEVSEHLATGSDAALAKGWGTGFFVLKSIIAGVAVLTLPFALRGRGRDVAALCTLAWVYEFAILSVFAEPLVRYVALGFVPLTVGAAVGAVSAWDRWRTVDA